MNKNILVTGIEGFIGSNLALRAAKSNFNVIGLSREKENWDAVEYINKLKKISKNKKFECVVHFGAIASTRIIDEKIIHGFNVEAVEIIANFCSQTDTPLIFASSAAIYGNKNNSLSYYAETKLKGESILKDTRNLRFTALRLFNTYGFNEIGKNEMKSFISDAIISGLLRKKILIWKFNDLKIGSQSRDFVHVSDVNKTILKLIYKSRYLNEILDLGSGQSYKFIDIANLIKALDKDVEIESTDPPAGYNKSYYQQYTCANVSWLKLFNDGIEPKNPFKVIPELSKHYRKYFKK